jgi:hypothetical protein
VWEGRDIRMSLHEEGIVEVKEALEKVIALK